MKTVFDGKKAIAIIINGEYPEGSVPHTGLGKGEEALGLLTLNHKKGSTLKRHQHKPTKRTTSILQECFIVISGKIKIKLYSDKQIFIRSVTLTSGEALLTLSGGHEFKILEDTKILELKNGPYKEDKLFF
ncbi:MAG: hypothetical protein UV74_C0013G0339 [Candidatus Woesebacteria bacterium GW2011_GWB1_43_14]|uniref:Cupin 2 conserved barrel domain-containing protein n=1 Tax=Candidatus Woesebacteria bacterium GW2011_GWB1_43_14 TaxID=1618578 RepID=A0A0G1DI22_9BACT|nr:MAG: hypothetical protein UT21_C0001G0049 [Candidatus Woesebacteria bacterium GW2011_GWA1_39_11b]KKS78365.1 MAG: hypothetical protein UV51_C0001G0081 [Candidatus Woesebacteria bacterium GW2011_GWC1_42_9]KKS97217.1 MAG: hypothetical protein UV74_C0013G0339 [Candidatus Woesebacteria bacterium GW2011_GWB1_43_14]